MKITEHLKKLLTVPSQQCRYDRMYNTPSKYFKINDKSWITYTAGNCNILSVQYTLNNRHSTKLCIEYDKHTHDLEVKIITTDQQTQVIRRLLYLECKMCHTEEEYFMQSTVIDLSAITLDDFNLIEQLFQKYYVTVRHGK